MGLPGWQTRSASTIKQKQRCEEWNAELEHVPSTAFDPGKSFILLPQGPNETARYEVVYYEMAPGTVLVFDCNLLHRSDPNESDESRWALVTNPTLRKKAGAQYEPLEKWEAATVREAVRRHREELKV